jgi:hypothetical protein
VGGGGSGEGGAGELEMWEGEREGGMGSGGGGLEGGERDTVSPPECDLPLLLIFLNLCLGLLLGLLQPPVLALPRLVHLKPITGGRQDIRYLNKNTAARSRQDSSASSAKKIRPV